MSYGYDSVSLSQYMQLKTHIEQAINGLIIYHKQNGAIYDNLVTDVVQVLSNAKSIHMISTWSHDISATILDIHLTIGSHKCNISFMLPPELSKQRLLA